MTIQVVLADDQPLVRAGLRMLIEQTPDIDVAGEAGTGAEAVQLARDTGPDVVVMDIRMPGMDGIEATRMITAGDTRARVLVLTTFDDDDYVYGALAGRGERVPGQGHGAGGHPDRDPRGRGRRRHHRAGRHPPPDRAVRRPAPPRPRAPAD